jgi:hypothetical protein
MSTIATGFLIAIGFALACLVMYGAAKILASIYDRLMCGAAKIYDTGSGTFGAWVIFFLIAGVIALVKYWAQ